MRAVGTIFAAAMLLGSVSAQAASGLPDGSHWPAREAEAAPPIVLAQDLPSDVEQKLGIRPNSENRRGGRGSDWRSDGDPLRARRGYDGSDRSRRYGGDDDRRYGRQRVTECRTRYEEQFDPYRGVYVRRPVRVCRD